MKVTEIKESGSNNVLMWALHNNADIKSDIPLINIIDDEMHYIVTLSGVNMLELFRLTQAFRNDLRIVDQHHAGVPDVKLLSTQFPGMFVDGDKQAPMSEVAEHVIQNFVNIVLQMSSDNDIITPGTAAMYLPMISQTYDVQIPVNFSYIINAFQSDKSATKVFNKEYPNTLSAAIEDPSSDLVHIIMLLFVRLTNIHQVNQRLEKYADYIKFDPLNKLDGYKLTKVYMLSFSKYNPVSRDTVKCSLFNITSDYITSQLTSLGKINSQLEFEFAVQMPICVMQTLQNRFKPDMLKISYEASMSTILGSGLLFNDFVAPEMTPMEDGSDNDAASEHNEAISAYRARLTEANQLVVNAIDMMIKDDQCDITSAFAMLPGMYMTRAVIKFKENDVPTILKSVNSIAVLDDMFQTMMSMMDGVRSDISTIIKK